MQIIDYDVWIDDHHPPQRIKATVSWDGVAGSTTQDPPSGTRGTIQPPG